jgi:hypothetical protein
MREVQMTETRSQYQTLQANPPADLDKAILRCLRFRQGRDNAISRTELVKAVKAQGCEAHERQVREAVKQLRRQGNLIGSAAGESGGYYMLTTLAEFEEFDRCEFEAKISDMSETRTAMKRAARERFGEGVQMALFS